jgi:indolepyruvate ferredoxin oxidoreductase
MLGDTLPANIVMLGVAFQRGLVPVGEAALMRAIELNGVAVETNKTAFALGRLAVAAPEALQRLEGAPSSAPAADTLDALIARREAFLTAYQDAALAKRYRALVDRVRRAEAALGSQALTEAVARQYARLLAVKDEYEVARLYTEGDFLARVSRQFEGDYRLRLHLAPPLWSGTDPATGEPRKAAYGPWMLKAMAVLAKFRWLRGTALDPFGRSTERREERRLIAEYEALLEEIAGRLSPATHAVAVDLASLPEHIRGFGPVKARHLAQVAERRTALLAQLRDPLKGRPPKEPIPIRAAA